VDNTSDEPSGRPEIIVTGTAVGSAETIDELIEQSLVHVRRSRTEPGCISHGVHRDVENPLRLVFIEQWADRAALEAHFAQPGSADFVAAVGRLAVTPPTLSIFPIVPRSN
jgi:quinol monooxygenase YgiN